MGSMNGGPPTSPATPATPLPMNSSQSSQVRATPWKSWAPAGGQYEYNPATMPAFYQKTDPNYQARLTPQQLQQASQATAGLKGTALMAALPPELQSSNYMQFMNSDFPISSWTNPDGSSVAMPQQQQQQPVKKPLDWVKINANLAEREPEPIDHPVQPPPNHALNGYMQMMGGGNYGGVIPQSSYSTDMPGDPWGTLNGMGIQQNPSSPTGMTFGASPWGR